MGVWTIGLLIKETRTLQYAVDKMKMPKENIPLKIRMCVDRKFLEYVLSISTDEITNITAWFSVIS